MRNGEESMMVRLGLALIYGMINLHLGNWWIVKGGGLETAFAGGLIVAEVLGSAPTDLMATAFRLARQLMKFFFLCNLTIVPFCTG
jgi:hypothetical protein